MRAQEVWCCYQSATTSRPKAFKGAEVGIECSGVSIGRKASVAVSLPQRAWAAAYSQKRNRHTCIGKSQLVLVLILPTGIRLLL